MSWWNCTNSQSPSLPHPVWDTRNDQNLCRAIRDWHELIKNSTVIVTWYIKQHENKARRIHTNTILTYIVYLLYIHLQPVNKWNVSGTYPCLISCLNNVGSTVESNVVFFLLWKAFESFYLQQKITSPWASLMNARVDLLGSRLSRARHMSHHWVSAHVAANPASRNLTEWWAETWKQSFQFLHQISRVKMVQNGFSDIIFLCFQGTRLGGLWYWKSCLLIVPVNNSRNHTQNHLKKNLCEWNWSFWNHLTGHRFST